MSHDGHAIDILLVEDNPADVRLTREALREGELSHRLHAVSDGEEALAFLRREAPHAEAPTPSLILLDLNLPRKHGREVLAEIKDEPMLRRIPVVVLSSSSALRDVATSYDLHANCVVTKPSDLSRFVHTVRSIERFWASTCALPEP